ncbi:MAG: hypothetical protein CMJ83_21000, partial [Planctomycetes bacterium]|nr:hypothetical protein [Planctomycetota bacterium]
RTLLLQAERWTRRPPFSFRIEANHDGTWLEVYNGDATIAVGARFLTAVRCRLQEGTTRVRLRCRAPASAGVLVDDVRLAAGH